MSRTTQTIFLAAVVLLVLAVINHMRFVAGGSGLVLLVGLIYAYVVSRRDEERKQAQASGQAAD